VIPESVDAPSRRHAARSPKRRPSRSGAIDRDRQRLASGDGDGQGGERAADPAIATIGETAAAIEDRISEDAPNARRGACAVAARVADHRRVNSTAIDVSKILSNDAGDAAWAAYPAR
jgi:hypothetical protein